MTFKQLFSKHFGRKIKLQKTLNKRIEILYIFYFIIHLILLVSFTIFGFSYFIEGLASLIMFLISYFSLFGFFLSNSKKIFIFYINFFKKNKKSDIFYNILIFDKFSTSKEIISRIKNMEYNELLENKSFIINRSSHFTVKQRKDIYNALEESLDFFENQKERIIKKNNKESINKKIVKQL